MACPAELIELAHAIAAPDLDAVILAEGNVSSLAAEGRFWVKASGHAMATIGPDGFVEVYAEPLLEALDGPERSEEGVRNLLNEARVDPSLPAVPSTEAFMHAYLLGLPEVRFAAHSHPTPLLALLCFREGKFQATRRLFPDEIVLCGAASAWVPYVAPGLPLAREIRASVEKFQDDYGTSPKTLWLQNHGLITLGKSAKEAESATRMSVKAARVTLAAIQSGHEITWLTPEQIQQIANWPDEYFRQRLLWDGEVDEKQ